MDYAIFDGLALGDVLAGGSSPKPFRLFRVGENILTQTGRELKLTLSAEDLTSIAEYCRTKGEQIPIDSRHALFLAAERAGLSEATASMRRRSNSCRSRRSCSNRGRCVTTRP